MTASQREIAIAEIIAVIRANGDNLVKPEGAAKCQQAMCKLWGLTQSLILPEASDGGAEL